jgi:hypothetical protein
VIRAIAALALASASTQITATSTQPLTSSAPWWERVTVSVSDDGKTQGCKYESSLGGGKSTECSVTSDEATATKASGSSSGAKDKITRITFERRFTPAAKPVAPTMQPGDLLLGGAVMALAIDGKGAVERCQVVATSGSVPPQYGCDEASAERFDASAADPHFRAPAREGYMTILVYGHSEHVV